MIYTPIISSAFFYYWGVVEHQNNIKNCLKFITRQPSIVASLNIHACTDIDICMRHISYQ